MTAPVAVSPDALGGHLCHGSFAPAWRLHYVLKCFRWKQVKRGILRTLARAWEWRQKLETGEANTIGDLAAAEGLSDRFVSRQIRIAVSPNEAARLCSIGRTTLYVALSTGELKSVKIGTRRLITIDAIRAWLQRNEQKFGE